jgi:hypothetical protein
MKLITTSEARSILVDERHHALFLSMFGRIEGAPKPVDKRGRANLYSRKEIIAFGKNNDVLKMLNKAKYEYNKANEYYQSKVITETPKPAGVFVRFLKGDYSPLYAQKSKLKAIIKARSGSPKTVRISIGEDHFGWDR